MKFVETDYTDSAIKIMAEALAKTGAYDIFNQFPSVVPDAAGAGVILPHGRIRRKGSAGFCPAWKRRCGRTGSLTTASCTFSCSAGDQLIMVLHQDLLELPGVKEEWQIGMAMARAGVP